MLVRLGAPIALAVVIATAAIAAELQAPYQPEAASIDLSQRRYDWTAIIPRLLTVDLDPVAAPTQADVDRWSTATVVSQYGYVRASLIAIRKSCQFLCGVDRDETCHTQAVLQLEDGSDGSDVLAVFPGEVEIANLQMLAPTPLHVAPAWSPEFRAQAWPADETGRIRIDGWNPSTKRLQFSAQAMGEEQSFDEPACRASTAAGLTAIQCQSLALLAADGVPLLVSAPDYADAVAMPVASFEHDGALHVVVRLGVQAQTIYGLLVKRGDTWVPLFRKAERALFC